MAAIPPNVKHRCKHRLLECPANQLRSSCGVPADKLLRNHAHATQLYSNPNPAIRSLEDDVAPVRRNEINLHGIAAVLDHAVGFAHFYYHASTWSTEDNCHLQDLYVAPEARGQKMGKALIEAVAVEARRRGCSVLHWRTRKSNTSAQALYSQFAQRMDFVSYRLAL